MGIDDLEDKRYFSLDHTNKDGREECAYLGRRQKNDCDIILAVLPLIVNPGCIL